jgi:hypothetical protein
MVVSVCAAGRCSRTSAPVLEALRPVIRAEPASILLRTACLDRDCRDLERPAPPTTRVRVQPWGDRGRPARGRVCELDAADPDSCARTVGSWLRVDRLWGAFRRT